MSPAYASCAAVVEEHGLPLHDPRAQELVAQWHRNTLEICLYLARKGVTLDLVDASTLASMFVQAHEAR
jgi:hypothetical protein